MMNRRRFPRQSACTAASALAAAPLASGETVPLARVVDTHTHFYDPSRAGGVPWPSKGSPLFRTVRPDDWAKVAAPHGVTHTIVVEASPLVEDNQWILDLAAKDRRILGFVGNLDPMAPEFAANLKRFAANPLYRGIRSQKPNANLTGLVEDSVFLTAMKDMAARGLELDVNASMEKHGEATAKLAATLPDLRLVINHLGAPGDPAALKDGWKQGIRLAAKHKNVFCKVSALVEQTRTEWGKAPTDTAYYLPILDHLWESFGEDRLVYGSNWPVSDKGAGYDVVYRIVKEYFTSKGKDAAEKYFWKNSQAAYRWTER